MSNRILITAPYFHLVLDRYMPFFKDYGFEVLVPEVEERLSEGELLEVIADVDGVIAGDDAFTEKVFAAASNLKVLSKWGTGIDSFDQEAAKKYGVVITRTPGAFTVPVSDQIFAYILAFSRRVPWIDRDLKAGGWGKQKCFALSSKTIGIIGLGEIGKAVAKRARAFDAKIYGNDVVEIDANWLTENQVELSDLNELLERSDFLVLCCDLNSTSRYIIAEAELKKMKNSAYIINAARGPLIKEVALIEALKKSEIAGAGLDVFEHEPLPKDHPFLKMDNVLISPHNANSSPEHWEHVHKNTVMHMMKELGYEVSYEDLP